MNPDWNKSIAQLLPKDYQAAYFAYRELMNRWPQINWQTRLQNTSHNELQMADSSYWQPSVPARWKRVAVSGWSRLKSTNAMFSLRSLDDPAERASYHTKLIKSIVHLPLYIIWRMAGRLFKRDVWVKWGTELVPDGDVPASAPMPPSRTIKLEPLSIQWQDWSGMQRFYLVCGYDPLTDIFFVRK